jgi:hypothetical protein
MTFYKFCTLDTICKDNDTMNGVTVQHRRFIPTNFDWSYYASTTIIWSRVSSGSIVCDKWLDDWAIVVQSPARAKDFSSILCVHTGSGAHPTSYPMGTGGPFPGGKAQSGRDADHSPSSSAEVVNE